MFLTIKEFWLRWRLNVAQARVGANTRFRKKLIERHQKQVAKVEHIQAKLKAL